MLRTLTVASFTFLLTLQVNAQVDPGPRPGASGAGVPLPGLTANELASFSSGQQTFMLTRSVQGPQSNQPETLNTGPGLGPRFNSDSCVSCHSQPAAGGTSPSPSSPQNTGPNPQSTVGQKNGATNTVPFFVQADGPAREARFKFNPDGTRDGGVHDLFVISSRNDAPGCTIQQPDFLSARNRDNLSFRIPTPVFGLGLVEAVPDSAIIANISSNSELKRRLGISGHPNHTNDGTITRFGWKAQNKSMVVFAGEASNVELGRTNELFDTERDETPGCLFNRTPEDHMNLDAGSANEMMPDLIRLSLFMELLAPPVPVTSYSNVTAQSIANGQNLFLSAKVGCALCHTPQLPLSPSSTDAIAAVRQANLFSDLLVHHMGSGLADDVIQGEAGPDEFRTAPLWGVGQRIFFLHDGRTSDLMEAIQAHASRGNGCRPAPETHDSDSRGPCFSEAQQVIDNFNRLSASDRQDILNFLRSL